MTPPYRINRGALAITTLAGSRLLLPAEASPVLGRLAAFLEGFTLILPGRRHLVDPPLAAARLRGTLRALARVLLGRGRSSGEGR
jgi:hypothetical protein